MKPPPGGPGTQISLGEAVSALLAQGWRTAAISRHLGVSLNLVQAEKERLHREAREGSPIAKEELPPTWEERLGSTVCRSYQTMVSRYLAGAGKASPEPTANPYALTPDGVRKAFDDGLFSHRPAAIDEQGFALLREMAGLPPGPSTVKTKLATSLARALGSDHP